MTPAEFTATCAKLGLSTQDIASLTGVAEGTIQQWQRGKKLRYDVPVEVGEIIGQLEKTFAAMVANSCKTIAEQIAKHGSPEGVSLLVYTKQAHAPEWLTIPVRMHQAVTKRVQDELTQCGIAVRIVFFKPEMFEAWCNANNKSDTPDARAQWAGTQIRD